MEGPAVVKFSYSQEGVDETETVVESAPSKNIMDFVRGSPEPEEASFIEIEQVSETETEVRVKSKNTALRMDKESFPEGVSFGVKKVEGFISQGQAEGIGFYVSIDVNNQPSKPIELKVSYDESELGGISEKTLRMYHFNEDSQAWEIVAPSGVNTEENYVWAKVSHFSDYGPMGGGPNWNSLWANATVINVLPSFGSISLNPASPITKADGTVVSSWVTITDNNGYGDITSGRCDWVGPTTSFMNESASIVMLSDSTVNFTCSRTFNSSHESGSWELNMTAIDGVLTNSSAQKQFEYG